jgi:hypothetical protein
MYRLGASAIDCNLVPGNIGTSVGWFEMAVIFTALLKPLTFVTIFYELSNIFFERWPSKVGPQGVSQSDYSWMS